MYETSEIFRLPNVEHLFGWIWASLLQIVQIKVNVHHKKYFQKDIFQDCNQIKFQSDLTIILTKSEYPIIVLDQSTWSGVVWGNGAPIPGFPRPHPEFSGTGRGRG